MDFIREFLFPHAITNVSSSVRALTAVQQTVGSSLPHARCRPCRCPPGPRSASSWWGWWEEDLSCGWRWKMMRMTTKKKRMRRRKTRTKTGTGVWGPLSKLLHLQGGRQKIKAIVTNYVYFQVWEFKHWYEAEIRLTSLQHKLQKRRIWLNQAEF